MFSSAANRRFLIKEMALTKTQKQKILEDLKEKIAKQKAIIFVDFSGLKVKDFSDLRKRLGKINSELKVAKKTLLALVFKEKGLKIDIEKLKGEIALIFGFQDKISPAKIGYQFSQEGKNLKILGGFFENKFLEAEKVIELAQLPTKEELLARLVSNIAAPISNFINVLHGNIKGLILALNAISKLK